MYQKSVPKKTTIPKAKSPNQAAKNSGIVSVKAPIAEITPLDSVPSALLSATKEGNVIRNKENEITTTYATDDPNVVLVKNTKIISVKKPITLEPAVQAPAQKVKRQNSSKNSKIGPVETIAQPPKKSSENPTKSKPSPLLRKKSSPDSSSIKLSPDSGGSIKLSPDSGGSLKLSPITIKTPEAVNSSKRSKDRGLGVSKTSLEILQTPLSSFLKRHVVVKTHIPNQLQNNMEEDKKKEFKKKKNQISRRQLSTTKDASSDEGTNYKMASNTSYQMSMKESRHASIAKEHKSKEHKSKEHKTKTRRPKTPEPHIRPSSIFKDRRFIDRFGCACGIPPHNYCRCLVCKKLDFNDCPLLP